MAEPKERNCKRCGKQMAREFRKTKDGTRGLWVYRCESCGPSQPYGKHKPPAPPQPAPSKHWLDDYV